MILFNSKLFVPFSCGGRKILLELFSPPTDRLRTVASFFIAIFKKGCYKKLVAENICQQSALEEVVVVAGPTYIGVALAWFQVVQANFIGPNYALQFLIFFTHYNLLFL